MRARVARRFRELDEDGEGIQLADVATLLTDVLGLQLDRDAMLLDHTWSYFILDLLDFFLGLQLPQLSIVDLLGCSSIAV